MTSNQEGTVLQRQILQIAPNDYNLSVSAYVKAKDTRKKIDIAELNKEIKVTVAKIDKFRNNINAIVSEIES